MTQKFVITEEELEKLIDESMSYGGYNEANAEVVAAEHLDNVYIIKNQILNRPVDDSGKDEKEKHDD